MSNGDEARRYLENWQDEIDSATEYRAMAESWGVSPAPAAILAKPSARRDRAAIRAGAGSRHHCRERGSGPERLREAARNRQYPDAGPGAMACQGAQTARGDPASWPRGQFLGSAGGPASIGGWECPAGGGAGGQRR